MAVVSMVKSQVVAPGSFHAAQINNQMIVNGEAANYSDSDDKKIFFIEYAVPNTGTLNLLDADGNTVIASAPTLDFVHSPIKLAKGFTIEGDILFAKYFFV